MTHSYLGLALFVAAGVGGAAYLKLKPALHDVSTTLVQLSCPDTPKLVKFHLQSKMQFVDRQPSPTLPQSADMQLAFVRNSVLATMPDITHFTFTSMKPQIQVLNTTSVKSALAMAYDWDSSLTMPTSQRLKLFLKEGILPVDSSLNETEFSATGEAYLCFKNEMPTKFKLPLPLNPETAFWDLPKSQWESRRFGQKTAMLNLCAHSEMVDRPQPEFYADYWNPAAQDADGTPCTTLLGETLHGAEMELTEVPSDKVSAATSGATEFQALRGSFIFGWQNMQVDSGREYTTFRDELIRRFEQPESPSPHSPRAELAWVETSIPIFLDILAKLQATQQIESYSLETDAPALTLNLKLKNGRSLRMFWGPTDTQARFSPPKHFATLQKSLKEDDLVIYAGPNNEGKSLLPPPAKGPTRTTASEVTTPTNQVIAFLAPYSVSGLAMEDLKPWLSSSKAWVVTTASNMDQFAPAGFRLLAPLLLEKPLQIQKLWSSLLPDTIRSDDQLIMTEAAFPKSP